jgi:hypothetical protein
MKNHGITCNLTYLLSFPTQKRRIQAGFALQYGYLIYVAFRRERPSRYGYLDLSSAMRDKKAYFVHIPMVNPDVYSQHLTFAADHDLVVSVRFVYLPRSS